MRKIILFSFLLFVSVISFAQKQVTYNNPILAGFYPDPSICHVADDYYLVNSSFAYFPGLPIFHCKDLVSWKQIGNAMDRPEQLNLDRAGVSRGLFAPALNYHKGIFYIVCTLIDKGGNFVITAKDPAGPWSNPVWLKEVNGIDPSLFFDTNGKAYLVYNSEPPGNISTYSGHRTIRMLEFDAVNLKVIGKENLLINGGTDISKHPVWIEGPHIYQKDGWYYLMCAEGGTGYEHSEVIFRSKDIDGPFISYDKNPILTQRQLDPARPNPVTTTGHADLTQTADGNWWAVFLGCRPYGDNYCNTGRETFLLPVSWEDGWPIILKGNETVKYQSAVPYPALTKKVDNAFSGNVNYHDDFSAEQLNYRWLFLRTPKEKWYTTGNNKKLRINLQPSTCGGLDNPSFLAYRQQNLNCSASTELSFYAAKENEKAGIAIFQNENHFYFLCKSLDSSGQVVQLYHAAKDSGMILIAAKKVNAMNLKIKLKIVAQTDSYAFYFNTNNKWQILKDNVDATFLSTKVAGGFVGSVFALYATAQAQPTKTTAGYSWFDYKGNDAVYKK